MPRTSVESMGPVQSSVIVTHRMSTLDLASLQVMISFLGPSVSMMSTPVTPKGHRCSLL